MAACNFNACNGCTHTEREFVRTFITKEDFVDYFIAHGVLSCHTHCPTCGNVLILNSSLNFRCNKSRSLNNRRVRCNFFSSGRKGSFFENVSLSFDKVCGLVHIFLTRNSPRQEYAEQQLGVSSTTTVEWFSTCRKVCSDFAFRRTGKHYDGHSAELYFKRCFPNSLHKFHEFWKAAAALYPPLSHPPEMNAPL